MFLAFFGNACYTSANGSTWTAKGTAFSNINGLTYGSSTFWAVGGTVYASSNGASWGGLGGSGTLNGIAYNAATYTVSVGNAGKAYMTFNSGDTYDKTTGYSYDLKGIAYGFLEGSVYFAAVGANGSEGAIIATQTTASWIDKTTDYMPSNTPPLNAVCYGDVFVAVGNSGTILISGGMASPPVFTSDNTSSCYEKATATGYMAAANPSNGTSVTYSISGGADASLFSIDSSSGVLAFRSAPDYENPADSGGNNIYNVTVRATDSMKYADQGVQITVQDVNEAPAITSGSAVNVPEKTAAAYAAQANDPDTAHGDTLAWSIIGGADAVLFTINGSTGEVTFKTAPDYEAPSDSNADNIYNITVKAADSGGLFATQDVAITVTNVAEPPITATGAATGAGATSATLGGTVSDNGNATSVCFEYGLTSGYGKIVTASTPSGGMIAAGTGSTAVGVTLTDLAPSTTYHYRVMATSAEGTSYGDDATFVTSVMGAYAVEASVASDTPVAGAADTVSFTVKDSAGVADVSFTGQKTVTISGYQAASGGGYGSFNGAALEADLSTDIQLMFTAGRASAELVLYKAGLQTIGFTIADVVNLATNALTVTPSVGAAAAMVLIRDVQTPASNGGQFATQPQVKLMDAYGNARTADNATVVTVSKADGGSWELTGTLSATASSGVATFNNLGASNALVVTGAQLKFNAAGLPDITGAVVNLPAPTGAVSAAASCAANVPIAGAGNVITLTVKNSRGDTDTTFTGEHNVTITGAQASLGGTYGRFAGTALTPDSASAGQTIALQFVSGVATPQLELHKAGLQTIGFSIMGVASPATNSLSITPSAGAAAAMGLVQDIQAPATNGGQFAVQPRIALKDAYGNACTADSVTMVTVSKADGGDWKLAGTLSATASSGVVSFSGLGATNSPAVTNAQLTFSAAGLPDIASAVVNLPSDITPPLLSGVTAGPITVGNGIHVTSCEDGTVYLVPASTAATGGAIRAAKVVSAAAAANTAVALDTAGIPVGGYQVYALDKAGNVSLPSAEITILAPVDAQTPMISAQPVSISVPVSGTAKLSVTASVSSGTLSYQWYSNTADSNAGGVLIKDAVSGTYTASTDQLGKVYYYCVVTNTDNSVTGSKIATAATQAALVQVWSGGYAESRELTDRTTGVTVSGGGLPGNAVLTISNLDISTGTAAATFRQYMQEHDATLLVAKDIHITQSFVGTLTVTIPVGALYNGQTVTVLHYANGVLETYTATVQYGYVTVSITSLSPFAVVIGTKFDPTASIPKTGDGTGMLPPLLCGAATLLGAGLALRSRKRNR